jgi:hypothetical protein
MAAQPGRARAPIALVAQHPSTLSAAHLVSIARQALMPRKYPPPALSVTCLPHRLSKAQVMVAFAIKVTGATESLPATPARRVANRALARTITTETRKAAGATHARGIQCLEREARPLTNAIAWLGITLVHFRVQRFVLHALKAQGRRREAPTPCSVFVIWELMEFHPPIVTPRNVRPVLS